MNYLVENGIIDNYAYDEEDLDTYDIDDFVEVEGYYLPSWLIHMEQIVGNHGQRNLSESIIKKAINRSIKRILKEAMGDDLFVADEGDGTYNIFSRDDFDEEGYYMGHEGEDGYHIDDFDIVYTTNSFEDAEAWVEENSY